MLLAFNQHPLQYLSKVRPDNVRGQIAATMHMPYPADPLTEPEFEGLTYMQVALQKQARKAAQDSSMESLVFFTDRIIGKPAQVNLNIDANESYADFLKKIADAEEALDARVIDVTPNDLGL